MTERILMPTIKSNAQTKKLCRVFVIRPSVDGSVAVFNDAFHICWLECLFFIMHVSGAVSMESEEGEVSIVFR